VESKPVLVYIYGPPAAGKLTVARRLAELSGLPLFHNHLTVDAVTSVLPFGSEAFRAVLHRFRLDVFETAVSTGQSLIFTNNSAWSDRDGRRRFAGFADEADRRVRAVGGSTLFVCLGAPLAALESRLGNDDRRSLGKLTDVCRLRELVEQYDLSPLHRTDLEIDTGMIGPEAAARAIQAALPGELLAISEGGDGSVGAAGRR
jgi:chloramphenicol 3-O-phosphotransferase